MPSTQMNDEIWTDRVRPPVPGTVSPAGPLVRPDAAMAAVAVSAATGAQPFHFDAVLGPGAQSQPRLQTLTRTFISGPFVSAAVTRNRVLRMLANDKLRRLLP